jgi:hypothetical protein
MNAPWYQHAYRRMLVDMHIPDWDEAFLADYEPAVLADLYERARLTSVMFYCQSHVGLCYWPTKTGKMHENLKNRDIVGEMLAELRKRDMYACAYYSVIFNVWAFREHPEWRMMPAGEAPAAAFTTSRHGMCCPNNPEYRAFALEQVAELARGYRFDGFFFDMTFWPHICLCPHCRQKYLEETGREIPRTVDWFNPEWCAFEAARERWMTEFAGELSNHVKAIQPDLSTYHNFACALFGWGQGLPFSSAIHHDFLGADFYGNSLEQFVVSKLMSNLSENRPVEFMTSRCVHLQDHVRLKSFEQMRMQAFAATLFSSAFLFIDAIDIRGTVDPDVYDRIGAVFQETAPYEPYLGGEPVEDVAVYFSESSKVFFTENGAALAGVHSWTKDYPHGVAVRGACHALKEAHVPFGIITAKQLNELDRYKTIILPNVLRMSAEEAEAFRRYVSNGGTLYASRNSSLTETCGKRHEDFMLADVFGAHFAGDDLGQFVYMKPCSDFVASNVAPQSFLSLFPSKPQGGSSTVRLRTDSEGTVLGTLTLPYAHPHPGTVFDNNWASYHSSPPWEDTEAPVLVRNRFGEGEAIYCACDIEADDSEANTRLFLAAIKTLTGEDLSYEVDVHPSVWTTAFLQQDRGRLLLGFLNYQDKLPPVPIVDIPFRIRPPKGMQFTGLCLAPDGASLDYTISEDGVLCATLPRLDVFQLVVAALSPE